AYAADLALGGDLHGLLGAVGAQRQVRGKSIGLDENLYLAAARSTLQVAEDVAARFTPVAGNPVTVGCNIAGEVELVAVAGAVQLLLQAHAAVIDPVIGFATDALGRSVGKRNRSGSRPCAVESGERASGLGMASRQ